MNFAYHKKRQQINGRIQCRQEYNQVEWCEIVGIDLPVNCGATVPRVSFENLREAMTIGLYCSRTGSTEVLMSSDAACNNE